MRKSVVSAGGSIVAAMLAASWVALATRPTRGRFESLPEWHVFDRSA